MSHSSFSQIIVLMRHGERADCAEGDTAAAMVDFQGDPPLTAKGQEDVVGAIDRLNFRIMDSLVSSPPLVDDPTGGVDVTIVSSPFRRTLQTAEAAQKAFKGTRVDLIVDGELSEVFGPQVIKDLSSAPPTVVQRMKGTSASSGASAAWDKAPRMGHLPEWGETHKVAHSRYVHAMAKHEQLMDQVLSSDRHSSALQSALADAQDDSSVASLAALRARQRQDAKKARDAHRLEVRLLVTHGDALQAVVADHYPDVTVYGCDYLGFVALHRDIHVNEIEEGSEMAEFTATPWRFLASEGIKCMGEMVGNARTPDPLHLSDSTLGKRKKGIRTATAVGVDSGETHGSSQGFHTSRSADGGSSQGEEDNQHCCSHLPISKQIAFGHACACAPWILTWFIGRLPFATGTAFILSAAAIHAISAVLHVKQSTFLSNSSLYGDEEENGTKEGFPDAWRERMGQPKSEDGVLPRSVRLFLTQSLECIDRKCFIRSAVRMLCIFVIFTFPISLLMMIFSSAAVGAGKSLLSTVCWGNLWWWLALIGYVLADAVRQGAAKHAKLQEQEGSSTFRPV